MPSVERTVAEARRRSGAILWGGRMAKKPKKAEEADDAPPTPEDSGGTQTGGSKKKLLIFGALGLALLCSLGGGGYYFFLHEKKDVSEAHKTAKPVAFLDIREMMINLSNEPNQERPKVLKLRASLELKDAKTIPDIQPLLPRVEDTFQVFVRELRASDLDGSAGVYRLREELLRRVNIAVHPAKVDAVLFEEIIVQ
jgi:flagellar FliL protein